MHVIIVVPLGAGGRVASMHLAKPLPRAPDHSLNFVVLAVLDTPIKKPIAIRLLRVVVHVYVSGTTFEMDISVASSWIGLYTTTCREVIRLGRVIRIRNIPHDLLNELKNTGR